MAQVTLDAIYENGTFRLLAPASLDISEGERVQITLSTPRETEPILDLAAQVYAGLSDEEVAEVERIALDRARFFGDRGSK